MTTFTTDDRLHAEKDGSFTIDCRQKPLTDEQIAEIYTEIPARPLTNGDVDLLFDFARAIEQAHGIR